MTTTSVTPRGHFPILPLRNTVLFPGLTQVIKVGRPKSVQALKVAEQNGFWVIAVQQKLNPNPTHDEKSIEPQDIYQVGTLCRIDSMKGTAENGYQIVLHAVARRKLDNVHFGEKGELNAEAIEINDVMDVNPSTSAALMASLKELGLGILKLLPVNTDQLQELLSSVSDLSYLTSLCAGNLDVSIEEKQKLLEMTSLKERCLKLLTMMQEFRAGLEVQNEIRGKLSQKLGSQQRQTILREQMKAIRNELGEGDDVSKEDELRTKIDNANLPEEVAKVAKQEFPRLNEIGNQSPESHIIRNYLELLLALPWNATSGAEDIDLKKARETLEIDHFGLEKVKKRILQHLAVMKLKKNGKGSILCLVGPPGVGKTSLGQSIAKALGKKYARVSLGGVRDDAEIRGHRKTYIGAMPGRIIQALKKAGERDPVFVLDEIDKLSHSFNGDPASALLEVLDPEQNAQFLDHYLDVGFDLSKVFFIATANNLENIPLPLLDRMEIIDLSGYTVIEKMNIARSHLVPKSMEELGISPEQVRIGDEVLMRLINSYTREAGVRDLQRKILTLLRGKAETILDASGQAVTIDLLAVEEILGQERFEPELAQTIPRAGVVTGLAWTPVGGDILLVESERVHGKGQVIITGKLGDVMKESAQIALSLAKNIVLESSEDTRLEKYDLHIHVPSGAIPKDGPSAGVTLLTSLVSKLKGIPVPADLAMTGEITLRGSVTPVGGIKEKVLAAARAGIKQIILPMKNKKDLAEVPDEVKAQIKFYFVSEVSEVLKIALGIDINEPVVVMEATATPAASPNNGSSN